MSADLSLAEACLQGSEEAWETLLSRYRSAVLAFARAIAKDEAVAQEIASSVWADLYGTRKLASYSGRGSFEGWLRTLVAQAYVDRYRKERRFVALDEDSCWKRSSGLTVDDRAEQCDARLEHALDRALAELTSEQRLILSAHYLDGRTFAEIGAMLGAHESTVHRQCRKNVELVRRRTGHYLRLGGMSIREAQEAMGGDIRLITLDVRKRLQLVKNTP